MKAVSELKLCLAILAIVMLLQSPIGNPHMYSTETSHPDSFDSFVRPPTCTARNFQLRKIYEAPTTRVSPVISPEGFFLKITTSILSSIGRPLLAPVFCICLNNQSTQKPPAQLWVSINSVRHSSPVSCYLSALCHLR